MNDKNRIRDLVQRNMMLEAKSLCVTTCKKNPDDAECWFLHGMLNGMIKDFSGSDLCYDNVIRIMPDMTAAHYNKGIALKELGQYKNALASFKKVAELEPAFQNIDMMIADIFTILGDFDMAAKYYQKILNADLKNYHANYKYGTMLQMQEKHKEAEQYFRKVISLKSDYADAYFNLAMTLQFQDILDEAEIFYKKTIDVRPDYFQAYNNLGILYKETENYETAVNFFRKAVALKPDYANAYSNLGHIYHILEKYSNALTAYQKANNLISDCAETHYNVGLQYEKLGQFNSAKKYFSQAILLDPDSNRYPLVMARVYATEKNYDEAITYYKKAIDKDPAFADTYGFLGRVYMDVGDVQSAITNFRKAYKVNPEHVTANYYLAELDSDFNKNEARTRYVENLFDNYADTFENDLVNNLKYRTPSVIHEQVMRHMYASNNLVIFDLGCGTGLCGELFRDVAGRLVGVDLSSKIVEKAREKSVYDELQVDELISALQKESASIDIILAADVYVYIGDLKPVFDAVASALKPGGLYSFSVEYNDGNLYELQGSGRYRHSVSYIKDLTATTKLKILSHTTTILRKEFGVDVQGGVYVLGLLTPNCERP